MKVIDRKADLSAYGTLHLTMINTNICNFRTRLGLGSLPSGFKKSETDAGLPRTWFLGQRNLCYTSYSVQKACKQDTILLMINIFPDIRI